MKRVERVLGSLFLIILSSMLLFLPAISAQEQDYKIEIKPSKDVFQPGENITLRVSLLDESNTPINEKIELKIENTKTGKSLKYNATSNKFLNLDLKDDAGSGYYIITVIYNEEETKTLFEIEAEEIANFQLNDEILTVTNIGNTKYERTIQIIIGNTISTKNPHLDIGESVEYRLVAPEGSYSVKITDGLNTITQSQVSLTGTGQAIGAIDERSSKRSGITGGISPGEEDDIAILSFMKQGQGVYVFMLTVIGAFILLAIERYYSKKDKADEQ